MGGILDGILRGILGGVWNSIGLNIPPKILSRIPPTEFYP